MFKSRTETFEKRSILQRSRNLIHEPIDPTKYVSFQDQEIIG